MQPERLAHYRIVRPLGSGGMGEVFLAEDTRLNRKVALKLLRTDLSDGGPARRRLLREARISARLDHPNVCSVYEVGEGELGAYIAMQYIEGESLADLMVRGQLKLSHLLDIGIQVADALADAHARGLIHRDVKPHNIMITAQGQAKVLDFGLAKHIDPLPVGDTGTLLTNPGMVLGTVPYMSPEQVRGEELDGRSDVFSLGAVLFELATGRRPFEAESGVELMALILTHDPFDAGNPNLPLLPELRRILQRALVKDKNRRYPGALELREDLVRLRALIEADDTPRVRGDDTLIRRPLLPGTSGTRPAAGRPRAAWRPRALGLGGALLTTAVLASYLWLKPGPTVTSIAVLPIVNESGEAALDYLSDGLTENLIQQLSHLQGLKVIARASILRFKGQSPDPAAVGRELGVRAVVMGRMRSRDGQLLLNLELAEAKGRSRLWGTQLQRPASDLVTLQDSLSRELAQHLGRDSEAADLQALQQARVKTSSAQAYDLYLKGRFFADRWVPGEVDRGLACFDQALALDPIFVLARLGKANAYWGLSGAFRPGGEMMPKAKAEAEAVLRLEPNHPEALVLRGLATFTYDCDSARAEPDFAKALALAPSSPAVLQTLGFIRMAQGRSPEGITLEKRALEGDPLSPIPWTFLAMAQQTAGDYRASSESARRVLSLEPDMWWGNLILGLNHLYQGRPAEGMKYVEAAAASRSNYAVAFKGKFLGLMGRRAEAREILRFLQSPKAREAGYVSPIHLALVHLGLGEHQEALACLEKALELHEEEATGIPSLAHWRELRSAPGYPAFLAKLQARGYGAEPRAAVDH
ncbi:MAG TPA: protein kinase [Holophagaceae bacterium]|nr:protein kinase [Holophagaceae bacterium]